MELAQGRPERAGRLRHVGIWGLALGGALGYGVLFSLSPAAAAALWLVALALWLATRRLRWVALSLFLLIPLGRLTWLDAVGNLDATKIFVLLLAVAWGVSCLVRRDHRLVSVWTETAVSVLILFFFLANYLSLLNTYSPARSALSLIRLTALFGLFTLVVAMVRTKHDVKIATRFLLLSGAVVCLIGVWEALTRRYLWVLLGQERSLPPQLEIAMGDGAGMAGAGAGPAVRIMGVCIDYNFMGGYMAVLLGIAGGWLMADRRWWVRLPLLGLIGLILYDAAMTGSRGGLMGLFVTAVSLLLLSRIRVRWFILVTLLLAAIALFPVVNHFVPQFRGGISVEDLKQDQRYGYWQMALHMMSDHPIIGVGTDNFTSLYPFYRVSPALMYKYYCHNIYLQMWAEAGIIGLFAILALVAAVAIGYFASLARTRDETWRSIVVGLTAAFAGYAVFSATCNTLHDQPFWLLMALSAVVVRATREEEQSLPSGPVT